MEKEIIKLTKKNNHKHLPIDCDSFLYKCPWKKNGLYEFMV